MWARCGYDVGMMWVPYGSHVGRCGNDVGMWDICGHDVGSIWVRCGIPRGTHIKPGCKTISDQHEFHTCKPRTSHVGPILVQCVVLAGSSNLKKCVNIFKTKEMRLKTQNRRN